MLVASLVILIQPCPAKTVTQPSGGLSVSVHKNSQYAVQSQSPAWTWTGTVNGNIKNITSGTGADDLGKYQQISFSWEAGPMHMTGSMRLYDDRPVVLCAETCAQAADKPPCAFPAFTKLPAKLHVFSYNQKNFAPPQFAANECSTPWLMFDDQLNSVIISPASHLMVASMLGDGRQLVASGMNTNLTGVPAGFTQQTLMVFGAGINRTWDQWGKAMRGLDGAKRPANDADTILKYFGYWTDNGAAYYYNYDPDKGCAGTLQALVEHYRQTQIPIRYLQLDSWWYYKSFTGPDGKEGKTKAPKLPPGEWNRYGGLLEYKAHPFLFPDGLAAFQKSIGLPLVTHNRWVDLNSPYRQRYKISGVGAVDPGYWNEIAGYMQANGIITYEQDWLDRIYKYSPAFSSNLDTAETFMDDMAAGCQAKGITMQYCMPFAAHIMQGGHYENLTSTRVSDDRFGPSRWNAFLYTSRLATSMGIWPWTDVFKSSETNNLLLATLSAGPVGIGDAIGAEDTDNIFQSVRADGVIVKPDVPVLPLDETYLADAGTNPAPMLAAAFTDDDDLRTAYVFAWNRSREAGTTMRLNPVDLGLSGPVYVYDYFTGTVQRVESGDFLASLTAGGSAYFEVVPVGRSGVAFFGDEGKFVSNGRQRIASLRDDSGHLTVTVNFAVNESAVTLHGASAQPPVVSLAGGQNLPVHYDLATGHFTVEVSADPGLPVNTATGDPARQVSLIIKAGAI